MIHEGGCLCGAVRYRISGEPMGSMVCHCRTCRKVSGAPVIAWLSVARETFTLEGPTTIFKSSPNVTRTFCAKCGTGLTYEHANEPGEVGVTICSLDDSNAFPPTHHSWLEHDLNWVKFGDGLPSFQQSRYGNPE
ncbi:hypothetical protein ABAC460_03775 [Asticcacaulis sp. AC460]|uniref:GFA family protein n=1 Tax=Asticcacaulis sp. AC460 TaxID=1282360 RepID=UPI0003C4009C|nr:GFA family protein [Asticcacaulis sp. AC460]ESQ92029.1 hypothetical protein ABAC460_03775 [Asticcacaulis sp. AC460]